MRVRERVASYFFALVYHACAPHVAFSRTCATRAQEKNEALLFFPPSKSVVSLQFVTIVKLSY